MVISDLGIIRKKKLVHPPKYRLRKINLLPITYILTKLNVPAYN